MRTRTLSESDRGGPVHVRGVYELGDGCRELREEVSRGSLM